MPNLKIVKRYSIKSLAEDITALEIEFDEVAARYESLSANLKLGDSFIKKVGEEQYQLMVEQLGTMRDYRNILAVRLSLLRRENARAVVSQANKVGLKAKAIKA